MILKICGITNAEDAAAAVAAGANAIGFNFYRPSPRYIAPERAAEIRTPAGVRRVGVFVNEDRGRIEEIARIASLDVAQLHGDEEPAGYPTAPRIWKGLRVSGGFDISSCADCPAEALVFDGPAGELYGGAGMTFDWGLVARAFSPSGARPVPRIILAGGLDAANVARAVAAARPWGVDSCSRIESAPGRKDHSKMKAFLDAAREALGA